MLIFGTIGIFRNHIPLSSSLVACIRGAVGALFLLIVILCKRQKLNLSGIKKNFPLLCLSGIFIGINWILLFEAYRYTAVSTATLCYYMAPVFVIIVSPFLLKEKVTAKKWICAGVSVIGMTIISGVFSDASSDIRGILLALGAALLYAAVIIINKFISGISNYEKTLIQLAAAALAILPYVILNEDISSVSAGISEIILLAAVGVVHTGIAYTLYFGSIEKLEAHTAAIFSYIDPVTALVLSTVLLREPFTAAKLVGSILILGASLVSELPSRKHSKEK